MYYDITNVSQVGKITDNKDGTYTMFFNIDFTHSGGDYYGKGWQETASFIFLETDTALDIKDKMVAAAVVYMEAKYPIPGV